MKIKTSELIDAALDWAVAKCLTLEGRNQGFTVIDGQPYVVGGNGGLSGAFFSRDWAQGGPIIERELIDVLHVRQNDLSIAWDATFGNDEVVESGPTPLIAAMRCYVASKLGDTVEVPEELT